MTESTRKYVARLLAGSLLVAVLASCGGLDVQRYSYAEKVGRVKAVVLLPTEFYFRGMESYQAFERWMDCARMFSRHTDLTVIGPDEVRILTSGVVSNLLQETNLVTVLKRYNLEPEEVVAVTLMLTESWQQAQSLITHDKTGKKRSRAQFESDFRFGAEAYHVGSSQPIFSMSHLMSQTVVSLASENDKRPELTAYAKGHFASVLKLLVDDFNVKRVPQREDLVVLDSLKEEMSYRYQNRKSLEESMAEKDEIERDASIRARVSFRYPGLERGARRKLMRLEEGLLVQKAPDCSNLREGDMVLSINGEALSREYQLERGLEASASRGETPKLQVKRGAETVEVSFDCDR